MSLADLTKTIMFAALFAGGANIAGAQRAPQPSPVSPDDQEKQPKVVPSVSSGIAQNKAQTASPDDEEIVEMSPFVVSGKDEDPWDPQKGIGAGRIVGELDDLAAEVDVITKEMLDDLGATDLTDMMEFDNGGEIDFGQFETDLSASSYEGAGLNNGNTEGVLRGGKITRFVDHEKVDWEFDTYNIARTATYYGANAILFGNGTPGGVKSSVKDRANLSNPMLQAAFSMNEYGSRRYTLDYGAVLIRHKLAVRAEMMDNKVGSYRKFVNSKRNAQYVTLAWRPFPHTRINIGYEQGRSANHMANKKAPVDELSMFYYTGSGTKAGTSGNGYVYYGGRNDIPGSFAMGQSVQSIPDPDIKQSNNNAVPRSIYDYYDYSHAGPDSVRKLAYRDIGINLEHRLASNLYISAYYRSSATDIDALFTSPRNPNPSLYIDPLPPTGDDDPFAGRIYAVTKWGRQTINSKRDAFSATLAWTPDFGKWGGRHNVSLAFDDRLHRISRLSYGEASYTLTNEGTATDLKAVRRVHYFDPDNDSTWHLGYWTPIAPYQDANGNTRHVGFLPGYGDTASGDHITRTSQRSYIAHVQSFWFNRRFVTAIGWRRDDTDELRLQPTYAAPNGGYYLDYFGSHQVDPRIQERQESVAYSAVLHLNKARNAALTFERAGNVGRRFSSPVLPYGDIPLDSATAISTTYGLRFNLLSGKIRVGLSHYQVISKDSYVGYNGFWYPITYRGGRANNQNFQIDIPTDDGNFIAETFANNKQGVLNEWVDLLYNNGVITSEQKNLYDKQLARAPDWNWANAANEGIRGLAITSENKGYSVNIRIKGLKFIRSLMLRIGYNYNLVAKENVATDAEAWLNDLQDRVNQLPQDVLNAAYRVELLSKAPEDRPPEGYTNQQIFDATYARLNNILQDWIGVQTANLGNSKHSFNVVARYSFPATSFLKGFSTFARYRWQDRAPASRLRTPVYDEDGKITHLKTEILYRPEVTASAFGISYNLRRSIFGVRTRMSISLFVSDPLRDKYKALPMRYVTQTGSRIPGMGTTINLPVDSNGNPVLIASFWRVLPPRTISLSARIRY